VCGGNLPAHAPRDGAALARRLPAPLAGFVRYAPRRANLLARAFPAAALGSGFSSCATAAAL
jgi:hypothetical protein